MWQDLIVQARLAAVARVVKLPTPAALVRATRPRFVGDELRLNPRLPSYGPPLDATPAGRDDLQVRTEYLHVLPDKGIARTDRHVMITQGSSVLSGVGLEINKLKQQVSLQSQVKGSFHVARRK